MFPSRTKFLAQLQQEREEFAMELAYLAESERVERKRAESEKREEPSE